MHGLMRIPAVIAASLGLSAALTTAHPAHAGPSTVGFGTPVASGIVGDGFEQDLRLDTHSPGHEVVYSSAPVGTGDSSVIWRSTDGGQTFKYVPSQIPPLGKPIACVGGGDAELAVDSAGHLYYADLYAANFAVGRSDDQGRSWTTTQNCHGVADEAVDRQWYTTIGDPTNGGEMFLVYDESFAPPTQAQATCPAQTNNALQITRSPAFGAPGSTAGQQFSTPLTLSCDEGIMGNDESFTYPGTGAASGPKVFVVHDNANLNSIIVDRCDVVAESATNLQGLSNCGEHTVSTFPNFKTGANFPTMSVDRQGNLFAVWEEAPVSGGNVTGNTQLYFSTSTDEGTTWSAVAQLPTPGLNQDVMAWPASGDPGRIDVAFYGTPAPWKTGDTNGPDDVQGQYSLWMVQTLDNGANWTAPILASEHFIHYGSMQTLIGGQNGNRGLGDFLQMRAGPNGEAEISYAGTNMFEGNSQLSPEAMYVRQNSGPSLFANVGTVNGTPALTGNCATDPSGDATFDANGVSSANTPHLDITQACVTAPDATHYKITMQVADLTSLGPDPTAGGTTNLWQVQWHVPSNTDTAEGGALFMAYMESVNGGAPTCWVGQSSQMSTGGGAEITYPGTTQLSGTNCQYTPTSPATITITVPKSAVNEPGAIDNILYSVTASSQTLPSGNAETPPNTDAGLGTFGGQLPNLVDVVAPFDFNPAGAPVNTPEVPAVALIALAGGMAIVAGSVVRRRRHAAG
ncbi:MAG: hypothetical protein ABR498_00460 [Candidatus Dormibacteria bacterium]